MITLCFVPGLWEYNIFKIKSADFIPFLLVLGVVLKIRSLCKTAAFFDDPKSPSYWHTAKSHTGSIRKIHPNLKYISL